MTLTERIAADLSDAMKRKDASVVDTLRMLRAGMKNAEIEKRHPLSDDEVLAVIASQVKQLKDAMAQFEAGKRPDLVAKNAAELAVLEAYRPAQMSDAELAAAVEAAIARLAPEGPKDFGKVMGAVVAMTKGRAEGSKVSELVRRKLEGMNKGIRE